MPIVRTLLPDLTPLRTNPAFLRLWVGFSLAGIGAQLATVAIGLHVFDLTGSTAAVGLVGLFALVPLVFFGLYGGALADQFDRRQVAIVAQLVAWLAAFAALQSFSATRRCGSSMRSSRSSMPPSPSSPGTVLDLSAHPAAEQLPLPMRSPCWR